MLIQEVYINKTKNARYGDSEKYEPFTDDLGKLFKSLQEEYGRCISKVYQDTKDPHKPMHVGWVFEKRMRYEDARGNGPEDYYIREVWVTFYEKEDEVRRTTFPMDIEKRRT